MKSDYLRKNWRGSTVYAFVVVVVWRGFGGRDLIITHSKFSEGARQPRLIVLATGRKENTPIIHMRRCVYDNGSEIGREGWFRWVRTGSVGCPSKVKRCVPADVRPVTSWCLRSSPRLGLGPKPLDPALLH
jgi:hypothetical protein